MSDKTEKELKALSRAVLALESEADCVRFLRDLCTPAEIAALAERWRIAEFLDAKTLSYRAIAEKTGASTATVGRVARFLKDEPHQGYRLVLDRLKAEEFS